MLNVLDEFTHECRAIRVARKLKAIDVIDILSDLIILRGIPGHIRSDNGPEFVAEAVQKWIAAVSAKTAYIERGSPWENGYIESFNDQMMGVFAEFERAIIRERVMTGLARAKAEGVTLGRPALENADAVKVKLRFTANRKASKIVRQRISIALSDLLLDL
jgi:transposase InsO family protein